MYNNYITNKNKNKYYNDHLYNAIKKYGFEAFEVDECFDIAYSQEELDKLEYLYVKIYNTKNKKYGYNNKDGGYNGKLSEQTKQKIREASLGKVVSQETREKMKISNKDKRKGAKLSEESRQKISEHRKGKGKKFGGNNHMAKAVYCYEVNQIRLTATQWADELGLYKANICACCKGRQKSTKGYHFRYATEEEIEEYKLKHGNN